MDVQINGSPTWTDWDSLRVKNKGKYGVLNGFKAMVMIDEENYDVVGLQPHGFVLYWNPKTKVFEKAHSVVGKVYSDIFIEK